MLPSKIFEHLIIHNLALAKQAALVTAELGLIELIGRGYIMVDAWNSYGLECKLYYPYQTTPAN